MAGKVVSRHPVLAEHKLGQLGKQDGAECLKTERRGHGLT